LHPHYASTFKIRDVFLAGKVEINNEHKKKIKINNLKATSDLRAILEKEFKNTS
jgi:ATP sulfurylase